MEDPAEQLIRRALGRRPPPRLGSTLADDVLRRVAPPPPAVAGRGASRRWLAVPWVMALGASVAVLAHLGCSTETRTVAWVLALAMVPLTYSATLWPDRALVLLALCSGAAQPAVSRGSPAGPRRASSGGPR